MSINSGVEQVMDAYRGDPNALAQRYQQSKQGPQDQQGDLIELIALQRLKSEKEAAIRDTQLKMGGQGKPPTLKEQREQQVMDMTKQEIVQEQAGVMQNKMREQQEAQKRLMQSAGAPSQGGGIMSAMAQRPPSAGVSGVPAPNMQRMAGGGIVAFSRAGSVDDRAREALDEEARQANASREAPQRETPRSESQSGMQAGLAALLGIRPAEVYRQRYEDVARGTNLNPEERAGKERQIKEASDFAESSGLKNFLLAMAGRSTPGLAIAAGGSALQNTLNQAMINRHRAEGELIDMGPASRLAGFVRAGEGERTAMTGLAQGTGDAVKLEQIQAAAARAGISPDDKRITQAYQALNMNPEIRALIKTRESSGRPVDDPENVAINRRIYDIAGPIFRGRGLDPSLFIPAPPEASEAPAAQPGFWSMVGNALTPSFGGGSSSPPPRRAPSGGVDYSNPRLRDN